MVTFQWEQWSAIIPEVMPLLVHYWNTGGVLFAKELPIDPDFEAATYLEMNGRLKIYTARKDGVLIGLNSFNCGGTLFRKRTIVASGLILYLLPSERNFKTGRQIIKGAETGLAEMGAQLICYTPSSSVDIGRFLEYLGYQRIGGSYEKLMG